VSAQGEAVLVDEGSFRIDRKRTLAKLMRYQLPDPAMFVLVLVRCAAAGGASFIRFRAAKGELEAVFDGKAFSPGELNYPYASLFKRASWKTRRNRELAVAVLAMFRLEPLVITVRSGEGDHRLVLTLRSLESEILQPAVDASSENIVSIVGDPGGPEIWTPEMKRLLDTRCALSAIDIKVNGEPVKTGRLLESLSVDFNEDGVRGWVSLPESSAVQSVFQAFRYGVSVGYVSAQMPLAQVSGCVNSDRFTLNASQTGIVRNARFKKALKVVERAARVLLIRAIAFQNGRMSSLGLEIAEPGLMRQWARHLRFQAGREPGWMDAVAGFVAGLALSDEQVRTVQSYEEDAFRVLWLRSAAAKLLKDPDRDGEDPAKKELWDCRLLMGADLRPLSLRELVEQQRRLGHVPWSSEPFPGLAMGFRVLLECFPGERAFIARWFRGALTPVTPLLQRESRRRLGGLFAPAQAMRPALEVVGRVDFALRHTFHDGKVSGEVALPMHPAPARIHLFAGGKPISYFEPGGRLRFAAAVRGSLETGEILASVMKAVLALYRKADGEYGPSGAEPRRDAALRSHLLDFLLWARGQGKTLFKEHHWIIRAPIFQHETGWCGYDRLLGAYGRGETLYFREAGDQPRGKSFLFGSEGLDQDALAKLFPGCGLRPVPSAEGLLMLYPKLPGDCGHGGRCAAAWDLDGRTVHLAPDGGAGGCEVRASWGTVRVFGAASPVASLPEEAGVLLLESLIREQGALPGETGPNRAFILGAVRAFFAPWPGKAGSSPRHHRLWQMLAEVPFFAAKGGRPMSLQALDQRLARLGGSAFAAPPGTEAKRGTPLLDEGELALVKTLWPASAAKLERVRPRGKTRAPLLESATADGPAPGPEKGALSTPARKGPRAEGGTLFERICSHAGLHVRIWLPPDPLPGLAIRVRKGDTVKSFTLQPAGLYLAGSMEVDASGFAGPLFSGVGPAPGLREALLRLHHAFLSELAELWPVLDAAGPKRERLGLYLLLMLQPPRGGGPAPEAWDGLLDRVRTLALFDTLSGGRVSLAELRERTGKGQALLYAVPDDPACAPGTDIPKLRYPRLVSRALGGVSLRRSGAPQAAPPPAPSEPVSLEVRVEKLFESLRSKRGVDPSGCPGPGKLKLWKGGRGVLLSVQGEVWRVNGSHPMARDILGSSLDEESKAAYFTSVVYSAGNRRLRSVTDAEDAAFQRALAAVYQPDS